MQVIALIRGDERQRMPSTYEVLREGDILLVEADSDSLKALLDVTGVELAADVESRRTRPATSRRPPSRPSSKRRPRRTTRAGTAN